jgi:hypothetical protein
MQFYTVARSFLDLDLPFFFLDEKEPKKRIKALVILM